MTSFKFQYDNTLSQNLKMEQLDLEKFKFQYDNTLSTGHINIKYSTKTFKFQYDNTLSKKSIFRKRTLSDLNSNMIIL